MDDDLSRLIDEIESNFDSIYQTYHQQNSASFEDLSRAASPHGSQSPSPIQPLPNKLPLKRRMMEYRHSVQSRLSIEDRLRFTGGGLSVEKFRDLSPSFVVAIFEDVIIIEPGDIGPISIHHPSAQELIHAINYQTLTPGMMEAFKDSGVQFYDGCIVVGLVDYRKHAFGHLNPSAVGPGASSINSQHHRINMMVGRDLVSSMSSGVLRNPAMSPEMHKILLRPNYSTMLTELEDISPAGFLQEVESKLLVCNVNMHSIIAWYRWLVQVLCALIRIHWYPASSICFIMTRIR